MELIRIDGTSSSDWVTDYNYKTIKINNDTGNINWDKIKKSSSLKTLELTNCNLTKIPPFLTKDKYNPKLKYLSLRNNKIPINIPDLYSLLQKKTLKSLKLTMTFNPKSTHAIQHNWIKKNSDKLAENTTMQNLQIRGGGIYTINIGFLTNLRELDLSHNKLTTVPDGINKLAQLTSLLLAHNNLSHDIDLRENTRLEHVHLEYNKLTIFPKLPQSTTMIYISHNKIKIVKEISKLVHLSELNASHNAIQKITNNIGNLTSCNILNLSHNIISSLPESIGNMTLLSELYLDNNEITELPDSIKNLEDLNWIRLNNNKLTTFPKNLPKELVEINIKGNTIDPDTIPKNILSKVKYTMKIQEIDPNTLSKEFEQCRFGIEIETCINYNGMGETNLTIQDLVNLFNEKTKLYSKLTKKDLKLFQTENSLKWVEADVKTYKEGDYSMWTITTDSSVTCAEIGETKEEKENNYYCKNGNTFLLCDKLDITYTPVEIVSPVFQSADLYILSFIIMGWLFGNRLTYNVNMSQGLHVNISNDKMNLRRFLKLWYVFEPLVEYFISQKRVFELDYAELLHTSSFLGDELKDITEDQIQTMKNDKEAKYLAVNIRNSGRIEVRIHQGTLDIEELYNWTALCMLLLSVSIMVDIDISDFIGLSNQQLFDILFTKYIQDSNLATYYYNKYNKNRNILRDGELIKRNYGTTQIVPKFYETIQQNQKTKKILKELQELSPYPKNVIINSV